MSYPEEKKKKNVYEGRHYWDKKAFFISVVPSFILSYPKMAPWKAWHMQWVDFVGNILMTMTVVIWLLYSCMSSWTFFPENP
jgi:hypothetical protein